MLTQAQKNRARSSSSAANGSALPASRSYPDNSASSGTSGLVPDVHPARANSPELLVTAVQPPSALEAHAEVLSDAELLRKVHKLTQDAKASKTALRARESDLKLKEALDAVTKATKDKDEGPVLWLQATQQKKKNATQKLNNETKRGNVSEETRKAVADAEGPIKVNEAKIRAAEAHIETLQKEVDRLEAQLLPARSASSAAEEASNDALKSLATHDFDFESMAVTDLALLAELADEPGVTAEFKQEIGGQVSKRFDEPLDGDSRDAYDKTLSDVAQAYERGHSSSGLVNLISRIKPGPLSKLFMLVQQQENGEALGKTNDAFISKLIAKVGDVDLASMKYLNLQAAGTNEMGPTMSRTARDIYVKALDAAIPAKMKTGTLSEEEFNLRSGICIEHKNAWSALHPPVDGSETPYLSTLTTVELSDLFSALRADPRWSSSDDGKALVEQMHSRFNGCLFSTDRNSAPHELVALAKAAGLTSFVKDLPIAEIGPLFQLLQRNSKGWMENPTAPMKSFVKEVNERFLKVYLPSISPSTPRTVINGLATGFQDFAREWNQEVAAGGGDVNAQKATPFGTLNSDDVAGLFIAIHKYAWPEAASDFIQAVGAKLAASYADLKLQTHNDLVKGFDLMPPGAQQTFIGMANRAPEYITPLLGQLFDELLSRYDPPTDPIKRSEAPKESGSVLEALERVVEYRKALPGADNTPEGIKAWVTDALRAINGAAAIAVWANYDGPFRTAWEQSNLGDIRGQYIDATVEFARVTDPNWGGHELGGRNTRMLGGSDKPWTPNLERAVKRLFESNISPVDKEQCQNALKVLKLCQTIVNANGSIWKLTATRALSKVRQIQEYKGMVEDCERIVRTAMSSQARAEDLKAALDRPRELAEQTLLIQLNKAARTRNPS